MLGNVLLYMSSSMLQVWSAILVFQILKKRDARTEYSGELYRLWEVARTWWHTVLYNLTDPNANISKELQPKYNLSEATVITAESSLDSFVQVITTVKKHNLVVVIGKAFSDTLKMRHLSPDRGQKVLNAIADRVEVINQRTLSLESQRPERLSVFAMLLNLVGLACILVEYEGFRWCVFVVLLLGNVFFGWFGVYREVALKEAVEKNVS